MMKLNLNASVKLLLTEDGKRVYAEHLEKVRRMFIKAGCGSQMNFYLDQDRRPESLRLTLWEAMNIFGPSIFHGADPVFEGNEIEIEEETR